MNTARIGIMGIAATGGAVFASALGMHVHYHDGREGDAFSWRIANADTHWIAPLGAVAGATAAAVFTRKFVPDARLIRDTALAAGAVGGISLLGGGVSGALNDGYGSDMSTRILRGSLGIAMFTTPAAAVLPMLARLAR